MLLIVASGALLGFLLGKGLRPALVGMPKPSLALVLGTIFFWIVAGIALHELGHVLGGLRAGFRFVLYTVGPFRIAREGTGIRPGLNRSINLAGGVALMVPPSGMATPRELAWFIAGGPAASLLASLLFLLTAWLTPRSSGWFAFVAVGAALNAALGLATIIPSHLGGLDSDGRQLLDLKRGGRRGEIKLLLRAITTASFLGTRPRNLDSALLERLVRLAEAESGPAALVSHLMYYYHLMDRNDLAGARAALSLALASHPGVHPMIGATLQLESAWIALQEGSAVRARTHLERALRHRRFLERHSLARVEAALLRLEGRMDESQSRAREGLALVDRSLDRGGAIAERDWLEQLLRPQSP